MLGEGHRPSPTIHIPPRAPYDWDPDAGVVCSLPLSGVCSSGAPGAGGDFSPHLLGEAALQRFLPYNDSSYLSDDAGDDPDHPLAPPVDAYSCDEFRMYEFKVRRCARGRSHDWTECPYVHPGEKARRRDPRRFRYSGATCPEFRKGGCRRGDACEFAHGVFECWLHPTRYRTQPCKDGTGCRRRVCFFAHTLDQLRVVPSGSPQPQQSPRAAVAVDSYDGSPLRRHRTDAYAVNLLSSPTSTLNSPPLSASPSDSPPLSPRGLYSIGPASLPAASPPTDDVLVSLRQLQLGKANSAPSAWALHVNAATIVLPRGLGVSPGFGSLPTTPTRVVGRAGGLFDIAWEAPAERVESGRELRAKIYEKLSKENSMKRRGGEGEEEGGVAGAGGAPYVEWISELVQ